MYFDLCLFVCQDVLIIIFTPCSWDTDLFLKRPHTFKFTVCKIFLDSWNLEITFSRQDMYKISLYADLCAVLVVFFVFCARRKFFSKSSLSRALLLKEQFTESHYLLSLTPIESQVKFRGPPKHFWSFTAKQRRRILLIDWSRRGLVLKDFLKLAPCSSFSVISEDSWKLRDPKLIWKYLKWKLKSLLELQNVSKCTPSEVNIEAPPHVHFMFTFPVQSSSTEPCFAVKLQKCFVDYETSSDFPSACYENPEWWRTELGGENKKTQVTSKCGEDQLAHFVSQLQKETEYNYIK